jgi:flagellar hook-associated protein 2
LTKAQTPNTAGFLYADISSENNQLNAKLNFNGISIQRSSNSISDLVSGVSFTLKSTMKESDSDVSIIVDKDVAAVKTKVEEFITKFNDVYSYIKSQSGINSGQRGVLWGDSSASSLLSTLNQINFHPVDGIPSGDLNTLSKIGISFNAKTGLSISDSAKFEQNVLEKTSEFEALFNSENGIANLLFTKINPYLGSAGMLANSQSSLTTNIKGIDDKIVSIEKRIDRSASVLRRQYEELQIQLATLLTTQSYFMPTDTGSYF